MFLTLKKILMEIIYIGYHLEWNIYITDIPFDQLVINNEKLFTVSSHFYLVSLPKIYKSLSPYAWTKLTCLRWIIFCWAQAKKKKKKKCFFNLFLGEIIFKLFCEKYLDLDGFETREACCLLATLCKLVVLLHMDFANRWWNFLGHMDCFFMNSGGFALNEPAEVFKSVTRSFSQTLFFSAGENCVLLFQSLTGKALWSVQHDSPLLWKTISHQMGAYLSFEYFELPLKFWGS